MVLPPLAHFGRKKLDLSIDFDSLSCEAVLRLMLEEGSVLEELVVSCASPQPVLEELMVDCASSHLKQNLSALVIFSPQFLQ